MHNSTVGLHFHKEKKTANGYLFYSNVLTKYKLYRINAGQSKCSNINTRGPIVHSEEP